jgi:hypothetical protein
MDWRRMEIFEPNQLCTDYATFTIPISTESNFQSLFNNAKFSDFSFRFKNSKNIILAHKVIISTCESFNLMLSLNMKEHREQICEIDDEEDDEELFTIMIKCLYGYPLKAHYGQIYALMLMADKYGYDKLLISTKQFLMRAITTGEDPLVLIHLWESPKSEKFLDLIDAVTRKLKSMIHHDQVATYMLSQE